MLKLFRVFYCRVDNPSLMMSRYVLAYDPCHAVTLLYREHDSHGKLNVFRHCSCEEIPCLNPAIFKTK